SLSLTPPLPHSTLLPYTTLFRSLPKTAPTHQLSAAELSQSPFWVPITPITGSLFHADSQQRPWSDPKDVLQRHICICDSQPRERSEEHTSELQSRVDLVCRLLLE